MVQEKCVCPIVYGVAANRLSDSTPKKGGDHDYTAAFSLLIFAAFLSLSWLGIVLQVCISCCRKDWCSGRISLQMLRSWLSGSSLSETEKRVQTLFRKLRHERLTDYVIPTMAIVVTPVAIFYATTWGLFSLVQRDSGYYRVVSGATLELFFLATFCIFSTFARKRVPLWAVDTCLSIVFLASGVHSGFVITDYEFLKSLLESTHFQVLIAIFLANPWLTFFLNMMILAWQLSALLSSTVPIGTFPTQVVIILIVNQAVTTTAYQVIQAEARARIAEIEAARNEATTTSLLSIMCDAVVHLRSNCTLRATCDKLNAMLFRSKNPNLEEQTFHQYIQEEDRSRFDDFLAKQADANRASALPVHLLDSMGRKVPAHIYHTSWIDADDELWHILGIQEEHDRDHFPMAPLSTDPIVVAKPKLDSDQVSVRSQQSGGALSFWGQGETGNVYCTIESTIAFKVTSESEECRTTFGLSLAPEGLLSRVNEPQRLLDFLTLLALQKAGKASEEAVVSEKLDESLNILGAGSDRVEYKASFYGTATDAEIKAGTLVASTVLQLQPKKTKRESAERLVKDTLKRLRKSKRKQSSERSETSQGSGHSVPTELIPKGTGSRDSAPEMTKARWLRVANL